MATDVPVVVAVLGNLADGDRADDTVDELELTADERERAHRRVRSKGNRELIISLERGEELRDGDVVYVDGEVAVVVVAAREDVLEVSPRTTREWAIASYQLGNLHRPARFLGDAILTPYDGSTEEAMRGLGVLARRVRRGFVGERSRPVMHQPVRQPHQHGND
jgi:urease accessory protein UreE